MSDGKAPIGNLRGKTNAEGHLLVAVDGGVTVTTSAPLTGDGSGGDPITLPTNAAVTVASVALKSLMALTASGNTSTGNGAFSIGANNTVTVPGTGIGYESGAFGFNNTVSVDEAATSTFAFGENNTVSGSETSAFGTSNAVSGDGGLAFGRSQTVTTGDEVRFGGDKGVGVYAGGANTAPADANQLVLEGDTTVRILADTVAVLWDGSTFAVDGNLSADGLTSTLLQHASLLTLRADSTDVTWNGAVFSVDGDFDADGFQANEAISLGVGADLHGGDADTNAYTFSVYDVNGTAYRPWMTATAGDAPSVVFAPPTTGTLTMQASTYKSSDGSSGVTAGPFTTITSITVKNGLVVALTGS